MTVPFCLSGVGKSKQLTKAVLLQCAFDISSNVNVESRTRPVAEVKVSGVRQWPRSCRVKGVN